MINNKQTCHLESPDNSWCSVLYRHKVKNYPYEQAGKGNLAQGYSEQICFVQEKKPSLAILCLLDNIRQFHSVDLPGRKLPGDPEQQTLLILTHTTSLQRWVCLHGCLTGALLFLARHLHWVCISTAAGVQRAKEPEKQGCGQHLRNRMPSIPQAIPLETGSESDSLGAYTEKKTPTTQHVILCLPTYLSTSCGISLLFLILPLLCLPNHSSNETALMSALHFSSLLLYPPFIFRTHNTHTLLATCDAYVHLFLHLSFIILVSLYLETNATLFYLVSRKKQPQQINPPTNTEPKAQPPQSASLQIFYAFYLIVLCISNITVFFP